MISSFFRILYHTQQREKGDGNGEKPGRVLLSGLLYLSGTAHIIKSEQHRRTVIYSRKDGNDKRGETT